MINPSANGWIDKFIRHFYVPVASSTKGDAEFYISIRKTGFIYGHIIGIPTQTDLSFKDASSEEITKIALLHSLFACFEITTNKSDKAVFISTLLEFYAVLQPESFSFFKKLLPSESPSIRLERIINERIKTNNNIISKNFSHIVTNALLFIDVLAFQNYLIQGTLPKHYIRKFEEIIINTVALALKYKKTKTHYDELLSKLFESSVRYTKYSNSTQATLSDLSLVQTTLEKYYLLDLVGMALWSDAELEQQEIAFFYEIGALLVLPASFVKTSFEYLNTFIHTHKKNIPYFNFSNPIKHFYDQASQHVILLITRNKKRLQKELSESKELVVLLTAAAQRELDPSEKKKMKKQLLDVCKTIPSLTIFLLPGGSILLPLLIKFIPQLLPSTFNENLD